MTSLFKTDSPSKLFECKIEHAWQENGLESLREDMLKADFQAKYIDGIL